MSSYTPTTLSLYPSTLTSLTTENRYWKSYSLVTSSNPIKHYSKVNHLIFQSNKPYDLAVAAATRISIYDISDLSVRKTLSRFKDVCSSVCYRADGKLIGAGSDDGLIQLFDNNSRVILRSLKGHKASVHSVSFHPNNYQWFYSGSDDCTVKRWDIPSETIIADYTGIQKDYIRTVIHSNDNPNTFISGSYDHTAVMIDTRLSPNNNNECVVMTFNHTAPIESLLQIPNTSNICAAGNNEIHIWDLNSGGKLLQSVSSHQKTITSLTYDDTNPHNRNESRLISAGLDHFVKFYDPLNFDVKHSIKFDSGILCCSISPDHSTLAVGTVDGQVQVRKKDLTTNNNDQTTINDGSSLRSIPGNTTRYFKRGINSIPSEDDYTVVHLRKSRLQAYDKFFKAFNYHKALDAAIETNRPVIICTVLDELIERGVLLLAISNRSDEQLEPILRFLIQSVNIPYYSSLLLDVTSAVLDCYGTVIGTSQIMDQLLVKLKSKIFDEIKIQKGLLQIEGVIEAMIHSQGKFNQIHNVIPLNHIHNNNNNNNSTNTTINNNNKDVSNHSDKQELNGKHGRNESQAHSSNNQDPTMMETKQNKKKAKKQKSSDQN